MIAFSCFWLLLIPSYCFWSFSASPLFYYDRFDRYDRFIRFDRFNRFIRFDRYLSFMSLIWWSKIIFICSWSQDFLCPFVFDRLWSSLAVDNCFVSLLIVADFLHWVHHWAVHIQSRFLTNWQQDLLQDPSKMDLARKKGSDIRRKIHF